MQNKTIKAGIVGGAGYTGGEMIRLLLRHPNVHISFVHSRSNAGKSINEIHDDLQGETHLIFTDKIATDVDVLFLCLGHGESKIFVAENAIPDYVVVIDLSNDFRLQPSHTNSKREFVYGLPEYNREKISQAKNIANPGCFATAIQLALLPLASMTMLNDVHVTGITGATGAGQKLQASSHFAWRSNNIQAYKTLKHQHVQEINETLSSLQPGFEKLHFVPLRGDFARGIYVTAYSDCEMSLEDAYSLYNEYYKKHPFVAVSNTPIHMKQTVNTNKCLLYMEKEEGKIIVHAAIDNLLKGASGQAVQNMNIIFGFDETTGLTLKPIAF